MDREVRMISLKMATIIKILIVSWLYFHFSIAFYMQMVLLFFTTQ